MPKHDLETSRHKRPRQECIDAGWDFPHEGDGVDVLVGELGCPSCKPRVKEKVNLNIQQEMLVEIRRSNDLKEKELFIRQEGEWVEAKARPRPKYLLPPPPPQKLQKRGIKIEPRHT